VHGRDGQETSSHTSSVAGAFPIILLIDDDQATCFLLSQALVSQGWEVVTATTVQEAEAAGRRLGPEALGLVIADVHLSGNLNAWEGVELYTRWSGAHPTLPFLLISGDPRCKAFAAVRNGSVGFLYKPFDLQRLFKAVKTHLRPWP
jgi:DNA-binding NtrC family response regulator